MLTKIIQFALSVLLVYGCTKSAVRVTIDVSANGDGKGNDTIRWETFPLMEKSVKIYSFLHPDYPEFRVLEKEVPASENKAVISSSGKRNVRKYYYLVFDDTYTSVVANRFVKVDSIMNLRDLGGYKTNENKSVKWGKFFCSGRLKVNDNGKDLFNSLQVKTIIDLRSEEERLQQRDRKKVNANIVNIPISACDFSSKIASIKDNKFNKDSAADFMQHSFKSLVTEYNSEFAYIFDILLDSLNYPVLVNCNAGNDRCGFTSSIVLSALGVPKDQVFENYLSTYSIPNVRREGRYAYSFSPEAQEAVTVLLSSNENFLNAAYQEINTVYGSLDAYFEKALHLDAKKRLRLQELLLDRY